MVLLSWPVALHAIRADKKGTVALLPAPYMTKDVYQCGKIGGQEPFPPTPAVQLEETFNFCVSRETSRAGAWAAHCPLAVQVHYWFACSLPVLACIKAVTCLEMEEISRNTHVLIHAWKFVQPSVGKKQTMAALLADFCLLFSALLSQEGSLVQSIHVRVVHLRRSQLR